MICTSHFYFSFGTKKGKKARSYFQFSIFNTCLIPKRLYLYKKNSTALKRIWKMVALWWLKFDTSSAIFPPTPFWKHPPRVPAHVAYQRCPAQSLECESERARRMWLFYGYTLEVQPATIFYGLVTYEFHYVL